MNTLDWDDEPVKKKTAPKKAKAKKPKAKKEKTETVSVSKKPLKSHVMNSNIYWVGDLSRFKKFNSDEHRPYEYRLIDVDGVDYLEYGSKKIKMKGDTLALLSIGIVQALLNKSPLEALDWAMENDFMFMRLIKFDVKEWDDKITFDNQELVKVLKQ